MFNHFRFIFLVLLIFVSACKANPELRDQYGNTIKLSDYRDKWILINYWAGWCGPCAKEIPALNNFYQAHKDKDAVIFGVNYDQETGEKLQEDIRKLRIKFPVLNPDPGSILGFDRIEVVPTSYLISPSGKIQKFIGDLTLQNLEQAINTQ